VSFTLKAAPAGMVTSRNVDLAAAGVPAGADVAGSPGAAAAGCGVEVVVPADCAGPDCEHAATDTASTQQHADFSAMVILMDSGL
jgi:hypothetical protein